MRLSELVTRYVIFKQAMGMCFHSQSGILRSFCRTMGDVRITEVDPSSVAAFLAGKGPVTAYWHLKFSALSGFYRFLVSRGYIGASPLPKAVPRKPESRTPHIYTHEELQRLLAATDALHTSLSSLQAATFHALLLTLYGTGLRISEALSLKLVDVDLTESLIIVHNSKFYKTRLVPIGCHLTENLCTYAKKRRQLPCPAGKDAAFFTTRTGNALSYDRTRDVFSRLRTLAGIRRTDNQRYGPRIHDIRHTFAVHRLEAWYREGADVQRLLPQLSTYLGHVNVRETQVYLSMTVELLQQASQRFEHYCLAEVTHE